MSNLNTWWRNRTSREKSMLLVFLLLVNVSLFLHLNLFAAPLPKGSAVSSHHQPGAEAHTPFEPPQPTSMPQRARPVLPASQRDPFRPPGGLAAPATAEQRLAARAPEAATASGGAGKSQKETAPPLVLTGVLAGEAGAKLAIIEYNGASRHYKLHDRIGDYVVSAISESGVTLSGPDGPRLITLRR